jgi:hypothetical protein
MNFLKRIAERIIIALFSMAILWLAVTQIFDRLEYRMPAFAAGIITYILVAYAVLPRIIQFFLMILRRGRIPQFTTSADGLLADPINIILVGSEEMLKKAFVVAGWYQADTLSFKTAFKMVIAFIGKVPYLSAPFSSLYLFGRKQDIGFQQPIGNSPRHRHHIRFWAANLDPDVDVSHIAYWLKKHTVHPGQVTMWVGSGTKDMGLGLTRLTYQISHKVDKNIDQEREYIMESLRQADLFAQEHYFDAGKFIAGKYVSDGRVLVAYFK